MRWAIAGPSGRVGASAAITSRPHRGQADQLEQGRDRAQRDHHPDLRPGAVLPPARSGLAGGDDGRPGGVAHPCGRSGFLRRLRLRHLGAVRLVCAAHHRGAAGAVPGRRPRRGHQLCDRARFGRDGVRLGGDSLSHLFPVRREPDRYRQDLLHRRLDVLAGQHHGARDRNGLYAGGCARGRSDPLLGQPGDRHFGFERVVGLFAVGLEQAARARPQRLERDAALRDP